MTGNLAFFNLLKTSVFVELRECFRKSTLHIKTIWSVDNNDDYHNKGDIKLFVKSE